MADLAGRRLRYVPLVAAALMSASACDALDPPDAQYGGVCVDQATELRIDDSRCGDYDEEGNGSGPGSYFMWISTGSTQQVPAHGQKVPSSIGSRTVPAGAPVAKGLPAYGGPMTSIQRGGFGAKSATTGGIGAKAGSGGS